jgi:hypothetical protein
VDATTPATCYKPPPTGDVDDNGDIIEALAVSMRRDRWDRVRAGVGSDIADDVDPDEQATIVFRLLAARGLA